MALNTITPSNREEEYLSAIAGDEGASAPVPSNRREEWLRRIAEGQGDQTERLDHIEDQIPVDPTSDDVGKVMTVVEDTSGETPVYYWSAEEAGGGVKTAVDVDANLVKASIGANKMVTNASQNYTTIAADNLDPTAKLFNTVFLGSFETNAARQIWLRRHIHAAFHGYSLNGYSTSDDTDYFTIILLARIMLMAQKNDAYTLLPGKAQITLRVYKDGTTLPTFLGTVATDDTSAVFPAITVGSDTLIITEV